MCGVAEHINIPHRSSLETLNATRQGLRIKTNKIKVHRYDSYEVSINTPPTYQNIMV